MISGAMQGTRTRQDVFKLHHYCSGQLIEETRSVTAGAERGSPSRHSPIRNCHPPTSACPHQSDFHTPADDLLKQFLEHFDP